MSRLIRGSTGTTADAAARVPDEFLFASHQDDHLDLHQQTLNPGVS